MVAPAEQNYRYGTGAYFSNPARHAQDAPFKARGFAELFERVQTRHGLDVRTYADVGCGSGDCTALVAEELRAIGVDLQRVRGYDVSPHVKTVVRPGVEYMHADFCTSDDSADLVTLFDVAEHVPAPVQFLRSVASRCNVIGVHLPLDRSALVALRDGFRAKLRDPGHLLFLDAVDALNLLAMAGLVVLDYEYSFTFRARSERETRSQRLLFPAREVLARISPWVLSKTLGGLSLFAVATTPRGQNPTQRAEPDID